jgi:beta-fructofuranosidase
MSALELPDYASKLPHYTFGNTLEEQELQLQDNPMLQAFRESRQRLASNRYRPLYHFVHPIGWANDPNGLCFWQGNWHLFYQAYIPEDPRQHWGHAVSTDLLHWRDLPIAIYPDPEEKCYSGATFVEEDRVIAMYHGTKVGNMVAVSSDPLLLNWCKPKENPVIPLAKPDEPPLPYTVFDPCIWKDGDFYYSLSGGVTKAGLRENRMRANYLFRSTDLLHWEYLHQFVEDDLFTLVGDDGACPYFWPIGDQHILCFFSHKSGGQYLLGEYDRERLKFHATAHGRFNFGAYSPSGVHAPSATPDGQGGVIVILNMNHGKSDPGCNQIMTLPRRLTLVGQDELRIEPACDLTPLRYNEQTFTDFTLPANEDVVLESVSGNSLEIIAEIELGQIPSLELDVLRSPHAEEVTRIVFYKRRGFVSKPLAYRDTVSMVSIDSSRSSILPDALSRPPETAPFYLSDDETLKLHVFVDKSVIEVFINGKQCVAQRIYPGRDDSIGVSLRSQGQSTLVKSLKAWQIKSCYE